MGVTAGWGTTTSVTAYCEGEPLEAPETRATSVRWLQGETALAIQSVQLICCHESCTSDILHLFVALGCLQVQQFANRYFVEPTVVLEPGSNPILARLPVWGRA